MYESRTYFASFWVVPFKLKKKNIPVPTASMGNSLVVNISQDHKSVQKKSHQMMKMRRITHLTTTLMMILWPTRALQIWPLFEANFWIVTKRNIYCYFFHLLRHASCFINVRCLILVLLLTICVINTITLYQKVHATLSVNI